ncbi:MAG: site-2 protease family protein [Lewinellaceae bacterium]|nr:site-2 protease family protein [Lewinellaceae bacterium]
MKWSLRIARVQGIDVFVHWTFLILLFWVLLSNLQQGSNVVAALLSLTFILLIFFFVLLHEFGHALAGRRFGVKTSNITLLPIGGVASMERMPEEPREELIIALAGPLVNLVLALLLGIFLWVQEGGINWREVISLTPTNFVLGLFAVNVMLFLFNLIPAFPMDGGRVLRAFLSMQYGRTKATNIAARVGQLLAIGFVFWGVFSNFWMMFIGIFIYLGAGAEANYESTRSRLSHFKVRDVTMHRFTLLSAIDPLDRVVQLLLDGQEKEFLVMENEEIMGCITRDGLIQGLQQSGRDAPVGSIANRQVVTLHPDLPLDKAWEILQQENAEICPVMEDERLIGVLNRENILEVLMIQEAEAASKPALV